MHQKCIKNECENGTRKNVAKMLPKCAKMDPKWHPKSSQKRSKNNAENNVEKGRQKCPKKSAAAAMEAESLAPAVARFPRREVFFLHTETFRAAKALHVIRRPLVGQGV